MSRHLGTVCDWQTSKRLLDVHQSGPGLTSVTVEVYGEAKAMLVLDVQGLEALEELIARALRVAQGEG